MAAEESGLTSHTFKTVCKEGGVEVEVDYQCLCLGTSPSEGATEPEFCEACVVPLASCEGFEYRAVVERSWVQFPEKPFIHCNPLFPDIPTSRLAYVPPTREMRQEKRVC